MARIGSFLIGALQDNTDIDYSAWFRPGTLVGTPVTAWPSTFTEIFDFVYRYAHLHYDYSIDLPDGSHIASSGDASIVSDEIGLICNSSYSYKLGDTLHFPTAGISPSSYDNVTKAFTLGYQFVGSGISSSSTGLASPLATTIVVNMLGNTFTFYQESTDPFVASGTYDVTILDWWPYDDGIGGGAPHGPIYDATTGTQLIFPLPLDSTV